MVVYVYFKPEVKVMKRLAAFTATALLALLIISCDEDSVTQVIETVTFEITAIDSDDPRYTPLCDPTLGTPGIYPVSIEFKPEIRIYPPNSTTYQVVALPVNGAIDPEYFGVTPCKDSNIGAVTPCIPCCEGAVDPMCTPCLDENQDPLTGNYRFTVSTSGGQVVGIFEKKNYQDEFFDPRDDAVLTVRVCLNGQFTETLTAATSEEGGGLYVIVPID